MTGTLRYISWMVWIIMFFAISCSDKDSTETPVQIEESEEGEVEMYFLSTAQTYSETTPGGITERSIKELDVLVFKNDEYQYRRVATKSPSAYRTTLRVADGLTLYFVVNSRAVLDACAELVEGNSWENDIQPALILENPAGLIGSDSLPMWGIKDNIDIVPDIINQITDIFLLRAVASVDIYNNAENFVVQEAYVYFAPDKGFLAPSSAIYDPAEKGVDLPVSPSDMANVGYKLGVTEADAGNIIYELYLYENDAPTNVIEAKRFSRIVVGGSFEGGKTTYYPVDLLDDDYDTILQATRNYKYVVNIQSVSSSGHPDPDTASEEFDSRMTINVIEWNLKEDKELGFDGPNYISLQSKHVYLYKPSGSTNKLSMTTNIETDKINMEFLDNGNGETVVTGPYTIENEWFRVTILFDNQNEIEALEFTALQDFDKNHTIQLLRLYSGRVEFEITIEQVNESPTDWIDGGEFDKEIGED